MEQQLIPESFPDKDVTTTMIMNSDRAKLIRILLRKGGRMKEHISPTDAVLVVVKGEINFAIRDENNILRENEFIQFAANEKHEVTANEDSVLLLIR